MLRPTMQREDQMDDKKIAGEKRNKVKLSSLPFWQAVTCLRIYKPYTHFHQPRKTFCH